MNFWKEHMGLRALLITVFFFLGLGLVIFGWTLKGQLAGLGLMMAGVVLLLAALMIYNKPFEH
ncbi:MAG: hypothetical protein HFF13_04850 [Angelakisella sp.]|jgi:hypothetical protein|nr:hypothetical protein [Angelakisella sp.]MCI9666573.1 hypothetical protein [Angelakisella sp.]